MLRPMFYRGEPALNRYLAITNVPQYKVGDAENEALCLKAEKYNLAGIILSPASLETAIPLLRGSGIPLGVTISYPSGTANTAGKIGDIKELTDAGADALVMVLQIGKLRDGKTGVIREELAALRENGKDRIKMAVLESRALGEAEMQILVDLAVENGMDWLVAGTGFKENQIDFSTPEDIAFLAKAAAGRIGIAALGGINQREQALTMLRAGANLIISEEADKIVYP